MSTPDPNYELSRMERLASILRDDGKDIDAMDTAQLAQYLKENKVDMVEPQKRFNHILKRARARQRLELAKQKRLETAEKAQQVLAAGSAAIEAVRQRVRGMIEKYKQHDPDQALVYAREFEKATPEDLKILEEDLTLLEMDSPENGKDDKQNPS
jgi:hypothetical protein